MSLLSFFSERFQQISYFSIINLKRLYPDVYFYFVESEFYYFFKSIVIKYDIKINFFELGSKVPIMERKEEEERSHVLDPNDQIIVIGRPKEILKKYIPPNPIIFVTIPFRSISFRSSVWRNACLNFSEMTDMKNMFIPRSRLGYISIPIGDFNDIFLNDHIYGTKSLKSCVSLLDFVVGGFERVYGVGPLSSSILPGFIETNNGNYDEKNVLIMMDRIVDLMGIIKMNTSYIGTLQEYGVLDEKSEKLLTPESLSFLMSITESKNVSILDENDEIFKKLSLLPLDVALKQVQNLDIKTTEVEKSQQQHIKLLQSLNNIFNNTFFPEVFMKIQKQKKKYEPEIYGRCIVDAPIDIGYSFRLLSILNNYKSKGTKSIARLVAVKHGLSKFAKWNRISDSIAKQKDLPFAEKVNPKPSFTTLLGSILSWILTDKRKGNTFPIKEFYSSSNNQLTKEKKHWFILTVGGMSISELFAFKYIASKCRPNDEFIFLTTKMLNQNQFIHDLIENI